MTLGQEDTGDRKYEVRGTKYEVKEIGATELRREKRKYGKNKKEEVAKPVGNPRVT